MTAATEDLLAAQTRTGQAHTRQANGVLASSVQASTAQAHIVQGGIVQAGTVRTHRIFIRATPEEIWDALTRPGWTQLYGYRGRVPGLRQRDDEDAGHQRGGLRRRGHRGRAAVAAGADLACPVRRPDPGRVGYPAELGDSGR